VGGGTIEIITGRERRRRWSVEEKLRLVAETEEVGARVTEVAARHGVYPGLLFTWRRQARDGLLLAPPPVSFVPVRVAAGETATELDAGHAANGEARAPPMVTSRREAPIEITLANGCRLRIDQRVDVRALRRIVGVLRG
jgi:transposase